MAIYSFREYDQNFKLSSTAEPTMSGLGRYMETHQRHYQQQCEYTICINGNLFMWGIGLSIKTNLEKLNSFLFTDFKWN